MQRYDYSLIMSYTHKCLSVVMSYIHINVNQHMTRRFFYAAVMPCLILTSCVSKIKDGCTGINAAHEMSKHDGIGMSAHTRYFRPYPDTLTVTTKHEGWTIDSVRIYDRMFHLKDNVRKKMRHREYFEEKIGWLQVKGGGRNIILIADGTYNFEGDCEFLIYISKDRCSDSIRGIQAERMLGGRNVHRKIGLWPRNMEFPADGGTVEATTKSVAWCVERIIADGDTCITPETECDATTERLKYKKMFKWVTIEKNGKEIRIHAAPDITGKPRYFEFTLKCGNSHEIFSGKLF